MRKKTISFSKNAFEERLRRIDEAIEDEDWFSAFANVVTCFEHYGYWAIRFYCSNENIDLTDKAEDSLKRLGATELSLLLRILQLICNETYSSMRKVISERDKIVHPGRRGIRYAEKKKKDEAIMLLKQAKECLKKIKATHKLKVRKK